MSIVNILVYTKNTFVIVMAMIVLAGTTGISYKAHYCNNSLKDIAFYTEIGIQKKLTCGCDDEDSNLFKHITHGTVLKKDACCTNVSYFSKLNIESPTIGYVTLPFDCATVTPLVSISDIKGVNKDFLISSSNFECWPPPLAGRTLVLFLSQQRIPFSFYSC